MLKPDGNIAMARYKKRKRRKTGGKFTKSSGSAVLSLSAEDQEFLVEKTGFDAEEIYEWFRYF